jgi:cobalt/nickel transport system permease protein
MKNSVPDYLLTSSQTRQKSRKASRLTFLDKTILSTARTVKSIYLQAENSEKHNFIQKINPYIKVLSLIYLVVVISVVNNIIGQLMTSVFILILFLIARVGVSGVYKKIFFLAFVFGLLVVLPASLNVITPGEIVFNLISFSSPSHFWIYNIPQTIGVTDKGIQVVLMVFLRVFNSIAFALLIVFTTPFPSFIKSFRIIGVPGTFIMIISLAYKYIFILARSIEETYFALKSRLFGNIRNRHLRKLAGGRIFFIFKRSVVIYEGTYNAMVSRGYHGRMNLPVRSHLTYRDVISLIVIISAGAVLILI